MNYLCPSQHRMDMASCERPPVVAKISIHCWGSMSWPEWVLQACSNSLKVLVLEQPESVKKLLGPRKKPGKAVVKASSNLVCQLLYAALMLLAVSAHLRQTGADR